MRARFLDNLSSGEITGVDHLIELDGDVGLRFVIEQIGAALRRAADFTDIWLLTIGWDVKDLFDRAPAPEAVEVLLELYERGPCASCRKYVVKHLIALDALPAELAEECRFDANEDVRALVVGAAPGTDDWRCLVA